MSMYAASRAKTPANLIVGALTGVTILLGSVTLAGLTPSRAHAEDTTAFTFKRVAVGRPTAGKRITGQIDPAAQAQFLAARPNGTDPELLRKRAAQDTVAKAPTPPAGGGAAGTAGSVASKSAYAWYWDAISPALGASGPGRLEKAVAALGAGPGGARVAGPRLATLKRIADIHGTDILKATIGTSVSPALVVAVIGVESSGRTAAVSHAGATGLMQLMAPTAARFGVTDRTNPAENIRGGVAYLDWLMGEFDRDPLMVLASYNAGENAVRRNAGVPPYAETRDYVPKVLAAWAVARNLCLTPPQLVSDGCVFGATRVATAE